MSFKGLTIKEKMQIAESVVPFDRSFNRRCPGIFASKCLSHQQDRNCPLDNKDADPNTFCEAYKQGDGYICNAAAKDDPVEDTVL